MSRLGSCQQSFPASGSHLLQFDPCRNKHGVKDKCLRVQEKICFSSMSVNVICHRDRLLREAVSGLQWSL